MILISVFLLFFFLHVLVVVIIFSSLFASSVQFSLPNSQLSFDIQSSLSPLSLRCKACCKFVGFLFSWPRFLSFPLLQFRKGPKCITKELASIFIPLIRFPRLSLVQQLYSCFFLFRSSLSNVVSFKDSQVFDTFFRSKRAHVFLI